MVWENVIDSRTSWEKGANELGAIYSLPGDWGLQCCFKSFPCSVRSFDLGKYKSSTFYLWFCPLLTITCTLAVLLFTCKVSTETCLYLQGKEGLMTDLRKELNITDIEHGKTLIAVNSDESVKRIRYLHNFMLVLYLAVPIVRILFFLLVIIIILIIIYLFFYWRTICPNFYDNAECVCYFYSLRFVMQGAEKTGISCWKLC